MDGWDSELRKTHAKLYFFFFVSPNFAQCGGIIICSVWRRHASPVSDSAPLSPVTGAASLP